ncbi:MAG: hypothetical protein VX938_04500, partial [Myxococcota bacterium]|nr:hypothetical protein [Myxococcota bacterium]
QVPVRSRAFGMILEQTEQPLALLLEAGELLTPALKDELQLRLGEGSIQAASIRVESDLVEGPNRDQREVRLVRTGESSHPDIWERVCRDLASGQGEVAHLRGGIIGRASGQRETATLMGIETLLVADPGDLHAPLDRLDWARRHGDHDLWRQGATQARSVVESLDADQLIGSCALGDLLVRISQVMPWVERDEGLDWLEKWRDQILPSALYLWWRGHLWEAAGNHDKAEVMYRESLQIPSVRNVEVGAIRPRMGLGRLAMAQGDLEDARRWTSEVLALSPRDAEALLSSLAMARVEGGEEEVQRFIEEHDGIHGHVPELWIAVGQDALHRQDRARAIEAFSRAAGDPPRGRAALRLARALLVDARPQEALQILRPLEDDFPEASLGSLACHLCLGEVPDSLPAAESAAAHYGLRDWIVAILQSRSEPLVSTLIGTARQVAGQFPWLIASLAASAEGGDEGK